MQDEQPQNELEEERDTRESDAVQLAEAAGDPDPIAVEPAEPPVVQESPLEADRRGAEQAEDPPIAAIAGAFVGAFIAAKLIGKLGGGDD
jgi:hypothetical protein